MIVYDYFLWGNMVHVQKHTWELNNKPKQYTRNLPSSLQSHLSHQPKKSNQEKNAVRTLRSSQFFIKFQMYNGWTILYSQENLQNFLPIMYHHHVDIALDSCMKTLEISMLQTFLNFPGIFNINDIICIKGIMRSISVKSKCFIVYPYQ